MVKIPNFVKKWIRLVFEVTYSTGKTNSANADHIIF